MPLSTAAFVVRLSSCLLATILAELDAYGLLAT